MSEEEAIEILKEDEMYITDSVYREFRTTIADKYTKAFETVLKALENKDYLIHTMEAEFNRLEELEDNTDMLKMELEKKDNKIAFLDQIYKELQEDFEKFKNNKDINYLDGRHHKQLVEKSIGQVIDKPEECWFDIFEVKVIKNSKLYGIGINDDFVTLKQISDEDPEECITVIAESPLSGAIYRYNNFGKKEWQLIGTMLGYA